ncbi:hypothetical protein AB0873_32025 [Micromonospora sp. NPDC047707]
MYLGQVAVKRAEQHHRRAEQADLIDVGDDLVDGADTGASIR